MYPVPRPLDKGSVKNCCHKILMRSTTVYFVVLTLTQNPQLPITSNFDRIDKVINKSTLWCNLHSYFLRHTMVVNRV